MKQKFVFFFAVIAAVIILPRDVKKLSRRLYATAVIT